MKLKAYILLASLVLGGCAGTGSSTAIKASDSSSDKTLIALKKAYSKDSKDPIRSLQLGQYYMRKGMWLEAEQTFKKAIRSNHKNFAAQL